MSLRKGLFQILNSITLSVALSFLVMTVMISRSTRKENNIWHGLEPLYNNVYLHHCPQAVGEVFDEINYSRGITSFSQEHGL